MLNATVDQSIRLSIIAMIPIAGDTLSYTPSQCTGRYDNDAQLRTDFLGHPRLKQIGSHSRLPYAFTDQRGLFAEQTYTLSVTNNTIPVANAGSDQTVYANETVTLDGSKSSDADGDPLTFQWSFSAKPTGSSATLSDSTVVNPTFVADKPGTYELQLIVNDGKVDSILDVVTISTENSTPVADAGPDQTVYVTQTVTLDGTKSSDVDGNSLTFQWTFSALPTGSAASLSDPTAVKPTFIADKPGT